MPDLGDIFKNDVEFNLCGENFTIRPPDIEVGGLIEDWMRDNLQDRRVWTDIVYDLPRLPARATLQVTLLILKPTNPDLTADRLKRLINAGNMALLTKAVHRALNKAMIDPAEFDTADDAKKKKILQTAMLIPMDPPDGSASSPT